MDVTIIDKRIVAADTLEIVFSKPEGFSFIPGQFIRVTVPDAAHDEKGATRSMSIASSPHEPTIAIVMRIPTPCSTFKAGLRDAPVGTAVKIDGPFGHFILNESDAPAMLIAGGVGIAPFVSIVADAVEKKSQRPITVIYSNRLRADAAYLERLSAWANASSAITFIPLMTRDPEWEHEKGYVTEKIITNARPDYLHAQYYLSGTPRMVKEVKALVTSMGVAPEKIHMEVYTGYS